MSSTELEGRIDALQRKKEAFEYTALGSKYSQELEDLREERPSSDALLATDRQEQVEALRQKKEAFRNTSVESVYEERIVDLESGR